MPEMNTTTQYQRKNCHCICIPTAVATFLQEKALAAIPFCNSHYPHPNVLPPDPHYGLDDDMALSRLLATLAVDRRKCDWINRQ